MIGFVLSMTLMAQAATAQPEKLDEAAQKELFELINGYRVEKGLPPVAYSEVMSQVARAHAMDMAQLPDGGADPARLGTDERGLPCNQHSWSNRGNWTPICYTNDHRRPEGMWHKPRELSGGRYTDIGFEIAAWRSPSMLPKEAIRQWVNSQAHNDVITESGAFANSRWQAMGVGIHGHYAFAWFGKVADGSMPNLKMAGNAPLAVNTRRGKQVDQRSDPVKIVSSDPPIGDGAGRINTRDGFARQP